MYDIIRIVLLSATVLLFVILSRPLGYYRNKSKSKKIIVTLLIILCLDFIYPFENLFYSFPNPTSAFEYSRSGEVLFTVQGKYSAQVVSGSKNKMVFDWFTKSEKGWKLVNVDIPTYFKFESYHYSNGEVTVLIEKYMFVNDYFISLNVDYKTNSVDVRDNRDSTFVIINQDTVIATNNKIDLFTCIQDINKGYSIFIDGEEIVIVG